MSTSTKHTRVTAEQADDNANTQEKTKPIVSAKDQIHYLDIRYRDEKIEELNTYDESSAAFIFSCIPRFIASHSGWCIMHLSPVRVHLFRVVRVTVVCS